MDDDKHHDAVSLEELQFSPTSFHLTARDWRHLTKDDELELKYFLIFYHEFAAMNYQRVQSSQSDLTDAHYRSRSRIRMHRDGPRSSKHRKHRHSDTMSLRTSFREKLRHREALRNGHQRSKSGMVHDLNVRDKSRRHSQDHQGFDDDGDCEQWVSEEIAEELKALEDKYENIRLDGYDSNKFFNRWVSYPFVSSLCVSCNIQTLCIGANSFYDDDQSMMTQFVNNAIDQKVMTQTLAAHRKYNQSNFWDSGGIQWFCDVIRHSYAFISHLSSIHTISLRDSNFTDRHLRLFCRALNSRKYGMSKPFTIRKLVLSKNGGISDHSMQLLFTTIGNKLCFLEELELNECNLTDQIAPMLLDFYREFHLNHNLVQLYSVSMLGNQFTKRGFDVMNRLFVDHIVDETRFVDGQRKTFHLGVNGKKSDVRGGSPYDMRLHIVVSSINISRRDR